MSERDVFPTVIGNEQETFIRAQYAGDILSMHEPQELELYLPGHIPEYAKSFHGYRSFWLGNGGLVYLDHGGSSVDEGCMDGSLNLELVTPECRTTTQASQYIAANERLLVDIAKSFADQKVEDEGTDYTLHIQKRSVDSVGNRRGCHDNYSILDDEVVPGEETSFLRGCSVLLGHLATRSFVSGAGHMTSETYRFAQKVHGLCDVAGYGAQGYMYRVDEEHGPRLEVRCGDINISPWAEQIRLGSTALLLALMRAGLDSSLPYTGDDDEHVSLAKQLAIAPVDRESGELQYSDQLMQAVDFQQCLAELAMDELPLRTDMPDWYWTIARELYNYCEDFRNVLAGDRSLSLLADRADWAAKLVLIQRQAANRRGYGQESIFGDTYSRYMDLRYDHIAVEASPGVKTRVSYGHGYKLRDKGLFRMAHTLRDIETALHKPPTESRAAARVEALRALNTSHAPHVALGWSSMHHTHVNNSHTPLTDGGPTDPRLSGYAREALRDWLEA